MSRWVNFESISRTRTEISRIDEATRGGGKRIQVAGVFPLEVSEGYKSGFHLDDLPAFVHLWNLG